MFTTKFPARRLSYANVMATIAVFMALGGGAYAAFKLPANSVGTKQLQNQAVVASKIKVHSLVAANFKPGALPAGPKGADGLPGPAGPPGDPATRLFATVKKKANGPGLDLGPSSGVQKVVTGPGVGVYDLTFNQDVSNCAVLAIPGGNALTEGEATAQTTGGAGVTVQTYDSSGTPDALDFFTVAVFC